MFPLPPSGDTGAGKSSLTWAWGEIGQGQGSPDLGCERTIRGLCKINGQIMSPGSGPGGLSVRESLGPPAQGFNSSLFREEMGLGVLITSGHLQSLHLVAFVQEGTHCDIKTKQNKTPIKRKSMELFSLQNQTKTSDRGLSPAPSLGVQLAPRRGPFPS